MFFIILEKVSHSGWLGEIQVACLGICEASRFDSNRTIPI